MKIEQTKTLSLNGCQLVNIIFFYILFSRYIFLIYSRYKCS